MKAAPSFAERVELASALLADTGNRPASDDGWLADQLDAARNETAGKFTDLATVLPRVQPTQRWTVASPHTTEATVLVAAAVLGVRHVCGHLRRASGPTSTYVALGQRRASCQRCCRTVRRPEVPDDVCDLCERTGVDRFVPIATLLGTVLVTGDACLDCAAILGVPAQAGEL